MRQIIVALFALLSVTAAFGQVVAGSGGISGVVRDPSGAVVPGAKVTISNPFLGLERTVTTTESGLFTAPALQPASGYQVVVEAPGFGRFESKNILVQVGQNVNVGAELQVTATTSVEVTDVAPVVDDTRTDVSQVVNQRQIDNLPINGRRVDSFVLLTPGTVSDGTFGLISFRGNPGGNTFLTDGNDTTNQYYGENAGRTRILSQISQDAVQEFQVLTSGYSAEYGRATGGVINTVTRGGTNDFHGTAFWFFRNRTLNARDRYSTFNPPEYRHQAGASLGGPVIKNKLFFFANTEITRRNFPISSSILQSGVIENGRFVGCTASAGACSAIQGILTPYFGQIPREQNQELAFGRLDWRPNEKHTFSASFNYLRFLSPNGIQTGAALTNGSAIGNNGLTTVRDRYARLTHTWIASPRVVNEFRFGWFKDRQADELGSFNPSFGLVSLTVAGVANLGIANYLPRTNPSENRFQFSDTLNWTVRNHVFKFGVDVLNTEDYISNLLNQFGSYSYGSVTAFAQDFTQTGTGPRNYQSFSQAFGNPVSDFYINDVAFFIQDQWRATPRLTLNLGMRYDYSSLPSPKAVNPDYAQTGRIPEDKNNYAPRVGFAYRIGNSNRTVFRAGYGIFYGRYVGGFLNTLLTNNNVTTRQVTIQNTAANPALNGPVFPNRLANSNLPGGTSSITFAESNLRTPYTQNGDLALEHQLTNNMALTVSYVWSRGVKFFTVRDLNAGTPGPNVTYTITDLSGATTGTFTTPTFLQANRVDPRYQRINLVENGGRNYYDGLAVQLNRQFAGGFQALVSYTYSHAIDTNLRGGSDNVFFSGGPTTYFPGDYRFERGSSALDQRHRATISFVAEPVITKRDDAFSRFILKGWQFSSITTLATPQYTTPTLQVSGTPFANPLFTGSLNGYGGTSRVPFLPFNSVELDPITRVDARVSKVLPFTERYRLYLIFEAFNVTNSQYDTTVDARAYTVSANRVLSPNSRLGVGTASAGFPDGTNARRAQISARFVF